MSKDSLRCKKHEYVFDGQNDGRIPDLKAQKITPNIQFKPTYNSPNFISRCFCHFVDFSILI